MQRQRQRVADVALVEELWRRPLFRSEAKALKM